MSKLLKSEIKRFLISPYYLSSILVLIILYSINSTNWIPILSSLFFWGDLFLYNNSMLAILLSFLINAYIGEEYFTKTIDTKLILGYSKRQIFICEILSCGFGAGLLVILSTVIYVLKRIYQRTEIEFSATFLLINTIIFMSSLMLIAIIICSFSLVMKKNLLTPIFLVCMTIFMIQRGAEDVSLLTFAESSLVVINENETEEGKDLMENNIRVNDNVRNRLNAQVMISPYAQCYYTTYLNIERQTDKPKLSFLFKNSPYHLDFLLSNITLSMFSILVGTTIFNKQDI